jgi:hypothetical protein
VNKGLHNFQRSEAAWLHAMKRLQAVEDKSCKFKRVPGDAMLHNAEPSEPEREKPSV